jgi:hypothetical protein
MNSTGRDKSRITNIGLFAIVKELTSRDRQLTIPRIYLDIFGTFVRAHIVNQIVFWCDHTSDEEGWIYKTQAEWQSELGVSRYQLHEAITELKNFGVEYEVRPTRDGKAMHFRINMEVFEQEVIRRIQEEVMSKRESKLDPAKSDPNTDNKPPAYKPPTKKPAASINQSQSAMPFEDTLPAPKPRQKSVETATFNPVAHFIAQVASVRNRIPSVPSYQSNKLWGMYRQTDEASFREGVQKFIRNDYAKSKSYSVDMFTKMGLDAWDNKIKHQPSSPVVGEKIHQPSSDVTDYADILSPLEPNP